MSTAEAHIDDVPSEEAPRRWRYHKVPGLLLLTFICLILMGVALGTLSTRDDAVPRGPRSVPSSPPAVVSTP